MTAVHVPTTNYGALRGSAVLIDRSDRARMVMRGDKAFDALNGLVTNDLELVKTNRAQRSVALTPKGRVIAMIRVLSTNKDELLIECEASAADGFSGMIKKFVNPKLAKLENITAATACIGVHGPQAATAVANAAGIELTTLESLAPLEWKQNSDGLTVIRSDELGGAGFDVIGNREAVESVRATLQQAGIEELDATALEVAHLESGIPRFGIEMDAETIPQEANLDAIGAMSFNKGCFTGQEVVARIHFRGHVNRHLRRLRAVSPLAKGDVVVDATGKEVGEVRSVAVSPAIGPIAIAMIRREVEPGARVQVRHADALIDADVEAVA